MRKNYYNVLSFVLIIIGLFNMFVVTAKSQNKINSFEVDNSILSGTINKKENGYIGILNIPKINLKQGFYDYFSPLNTVDKNIEVIETSKMPDVVHSNLILAAHSGNTSIAYFKNLDKLQLNDYVYITYNDKEYKYIISDIYDRKKTGYIDIFRDKSKNTITLITCKKNTNLQTVFIGYMIS